MNRFGGWDKKGSNREEGRSARRGDDFIVSDLFGAEGRRQLTARLPELPVHSREAVVQELETLDFLETEIDSAEKRLHRSIRDR
jgi:hypothetical protein